MALTVKHNGALLTLLAIIAAVVFVPFIGNSPLFDWDEVNFAECAREMIVSGNYSQVQLNYQPFWEKPPVFIWMQALSMQVFGINEFGARFPNALCGIASMLTLFVVGKNYHSVRFGLTWCLLYAASLLPHFYFKSGIIDPWFNLFMFLSVFQAFRFLNNPNGAREWRYVLLGGLFLGLAVLTKGPAAILIVALCLLCWLVWNKKLNLLYHKKFVLFVVTTLFVSASWFLIEWLRGNQHVVLKFIEYNIRLFQTGDAGHDGPYIYHVVVLLLGCFPASILFLVSYVKYAELSPYQRQLRRMLLSLFWVVLVIFTIAQTKILHYSSLCYYPLTFIATIGLVQYSHKLTLNTFLKSLYWLIAALFTLAFTLIGFTDKLKGWLIAKGLVGDPLAVMNLQADGGWTGFEFGIGLLFFAASLTVYMALKNEKQNQLYAGLALHIVFICFAIAVIVPKIERYSQHAAIEFYRQKANENCDLETHGFKSYAHLFYGNRKPSDYTNPQQVAYIQHQLDVMVSEGHSRLSSYPTSNQLWMEYGIIHRPAYIVVKTTNEDQVLAIPEMEKLYQKNGFSFFRRLPGQPVK